MMRNAVAKRDASSDIILGDTMPNANELPTPPTSVRSLMIWLFVTGFALVGGLGFWASSAQLNSAVIANGQFEIAGDVRTVQHLAGGIVTEIIVKEGDRVEMGSRLAELDPTRARAQQALLRNKLVATLGRQARLEAEFAGDPQIKVGPELRDLIASDPSFATGFEAQLALFVSNQRTHKGQAAILENRINQMNEQAAGVRKRIVALEGQLQLIEEELVDIELLYERGLTTRSLVMSNKRAVAQLIGSIGESRSELYEIDDQIAEYEERILQVERDRKLVIADELQLLQEQIVDNRQRLEAAVSLSEQLTIRAPISGQIVGFELNTIGAVIEPGQTIMRIVPDGSDFVVRGRVFPGDIDEVQVGAKARIRLSAYSYRKTPPLDGSITYVSADAVLDERTGESFYEVTAEIPKDALAAAPEVEPVPSMPAQVFISTGQQTVLTYLIDPVLGGLDTAMRENE